MVNPAVAWGCRSSHDLGIEAGSSTGACIVKVADTDWKRASWAAAALLGLAAFIMFGIHPGGFEGQIGWFLGLFPGVLVVHLLLPDPLFKYEVVFKILVFGTSFLWYFAISYSVIKVVRLRVRAKRS